jgi:predicted dienelactone hydrolase
MKPVTYQSRDGLTIHGYLTLPLGVAAKNLPVVVNPHGGPWARDQWGFNPEVQFLANRGYAVLQVNFRGSTGYGRKFFESSFKQWGRAMQDDVSDGVKWLIAQGIADSSRVAIYGGSYGGYATLAWADVLTGAVRSGDRLRRRVEPVHVHEDDPAVLEAVSRADSRDGRKSRARQRGAGGGVTGVPRRSHPRAAARRAGCEDPRVNINESNQIVERSASAASTCSTSSRRTKGTASRTRRTASSSTRRWRASSRAT